MPPKKIAPPIDRPLSKAYLRGFKGWTTDWPPELAEPNSLRRMENVFIDRNGAVEVRPGLRYLSYEQSPASMPTLQSQGVAMQERPVGSMELFYTIDGSPALLFAVRLGSGRVGFKALLLSASDSVVRELTDPDIGFTLVGGEAAISFDEDVSYVHYLQIDNRILALSDTGAPAVIFNVGMFKQAKRLSPITAPRWIPEHKATVVHPDAAWINGRAATTRRNLALNPSFKIGTSFWNSSDTTIASMRNGKLSVESSPLRTNMLPSPLHDAAGSGLGQWASSPDSPAGVEAADSWMLVTGAEQGEVFLAQSGAILEGVRPGGRYRLAVEVLLDGSADACAVVLFHAADGSLLGAGATFAVELSGRFVSEPITAPPGTVSLRLLLGGKAVSPFGSVRYKQAVLVPEGQETSMFSGASGADHYWTGTPNQSASVYHPPADAEVWTDWLPSDIAQPVAASIGADLGAGSPTVTGELLLDMRAADGSTIGTPSPAAVTVSGAARHFTSRSAPGAASGAPTARMRVRFPAMPRGSEVLLDDALVEPGVLTEGTYFDGSSESAGSENSWEFGAHTSTSIQLTRSQAAPAAETPTASTLIASGGAASNPNKMGFFYTFENEAGESAPSQITEVRLKRAWSDWRWETPNASGEPSGTATDDDALCADQLVVSIPQTVFDQALSEGAVRANLYAFSWGEQDAVPAVAQLIAEHDLYPDPSDPETSANDYAVAGRFVITPARTIGTVDSLLPSKELRFNYSVPPAHASGLVSGDRVILVGDPNNPASVQWSSSSPGMHTNFSPTRGGGIKTLTSGNLNIPVAVSLWQNPQSIDTITVQCTSDNGRSVSYYMQPAEQQSSSSGTLQIMGFDETTNCPGTESPYASQVLNNALYRPLDHELLKSTANNYNINHKSQTDTISNMWKALVSKNRMVSVQHDNMLYYLVQNPMGEPLREGCTGNEIWIYDIGIEGGSWSRHLIQASSMKVFNLGSRTLVGIIAPDGVYYLDPLQRLDHAPGLDLTVVERGIPWMFETNTLGANRAHDAWAHLQQVSVVLGNFTGEVQYGVHGHSVDGKRIDAEKTVLSPFTDFGSEERFAFEDMLLVRRDMKEWTFTARSTDVPSGGQIGLVQFRYTPVSVNVGYEYGSVESLEYGARRDDAYVRSGVPRPYLDYSA